MSDDKFVRADQVDGVDNTEPLLEKPLDQMTEAEKLKAAKKAEEERLKPKIDEALEKNKKVDG